MSLPSSSYGSFPWELSCRKAGFSPWLTLLNCIPLGNTLLLYMLALVDWKRRPMFVPGPSSEPIAAAQAIAKSGPPVVTRQI